MTLNQLRQAKKAIIARIDTFIGGRSVTELPEPEAVRLDQLLGEFEQVDREEAAQAGRPGDMEDAGAVVVATDTGGRYAHFETRANEPGVSLTMTGSRSWAHDANGHLQEVGSAVGRHAGSISLPHPGGKPRRYCEVFRPAAQADMDPGLFLTSVLTNDRSVSGMRILAASEMGQYSDPYGGFLVPVQMESAIMDKLLSESVIMPFCLLVPMASATVNVPIWDGTSQSSPGTAWGIVFNWVAENDTISPSAALDKVLALQARSAAALIPVSDRLLEDVPLFAQQIE